MRQIVVCGLGRFGLNVAETLLKAGRQVTVLSDCHTARERWERAKAAGAQMIEGDFRVPTARREAGIQAAAAVLLTTSSDVDNLQAALDIRGEAADVPVVMRHSEPRVTKRLEKDFGLAAAMSPAIIAAAAFVDAAMSATTQTCSLPNRGHQQPLPTRPIRYEFLTIPLLLLTIYVSAVVIFRLTLNLSWIDAAYFTTSIVTTVGFGDFNLQDAPVWVKAFGILLMFAGIVLVAIIASLLTLFIVSGAANQMRNEFRARRLQGHVVICGLGQVGVAISRDLLSRNIPVVAIDPSACDEEHRELNLRCPVIVGNATKSTVLARAGAGRARALIACTSSDALNLEIGLMAQGTVEGRRADRRLRLVLRCFDSDLARRIHAVSDDYTLLSEAMIAAPFFVRTALSHAKAWAPQET